LDDPENPAFSGMLDLSTGGMRGFLEAWTPGRIPGEVIVLEVVRVGGQLVALGIDGISAAAWTSSYGDKWEPASVQTPVTGRSVISHVVKWDGGTYAYGRAGSVAAVWRAASPDRWDYKGAISVFGPAVPIDVVASDGLLAVVEEDEGAVGVYASSDAVVWSELKQTGLDGPEQVQALAVLDGAFFAVGADCSRSTCTPSVRRSDSGERWETVTLPTDAEGTLEDITATTRGLFAVGNVAGDDGTPEALVLGSADGTHWARLATGHEAFGRQHGSVEVVSTSPGNDATAMLINGQRYDLGVGATVSAEAMRFSIADVGDDLVTLQLPGSTRLVHTGEPATFEAGTALEHVAAEGDRIVVSGVYVGDAVNEWARVATVWASMDGGVEWARSTTDGGAVASTLTPYLASTRILLVGLASGATHTWASEWDTAGAEELDYAAARTPGR
jgi:hypothetical protein